MRLGTNELIIILVIVLLIVGPTQIPKLAKLFGKASKKFKEGMNNEEDGDSPCPLRSTFGRCATAWPWCSSSLWRATWC